MRLDQPDIPPLKLTLLALIYIIWAPLSVFADEIATYPIAGVNPEQRPVNAPQASLQPDKSSDWYKNALHGIDTPYPASLRFLEDQGNWYTPFTHRGMTDRYDIRGWHSK